MIALQTTADLHEVVSTNDATVVGVLMAVVIAFGAVIVYQFKTYQVLNKEFIAELKISNAELVKMNNSYNQFVSNMIELEKRK
jgi:hypothetical protein